jgi:hypothetical protein
MPRASRGPRSPCRCEPPYRSNEDGTTGIIADGLEQGLHAERRSAKRSARVEGGYADHRKRPSTASRAASAVSAVALVQVSPVLAIFPA